MPSAEIIVLPVIRIDRMAADDVPDGGMARSGVLDLNAYRDARGRLTVELEELQRLRRGFRSLLPPVGTP